jgi:hypothetical protein
MSNVTKEFSSADVGTSTLATNTAGSCITLLDALLINGYNSTTATSVTVSGGVATYNIADNTYTAGQCLLIAGATGSYTALNGEFYVTAVTGTSFTFPTTAPDGTATGTITAKVAPMGWTAAFTGTNTKAYRQGGGQQYYAQIDNTSGQQAKWSAFETMSAINTGTNQTPTAAQSANLGWQLLSTTATAATAKTWYAIGNDRSFYLFVSADASANWTSIFVGVFASYKSGDLYNMMISGNNGTSLTSSITAATYFSCTGSAMVPTASAKYVLRPYTGVGTSTLASLMSMNAFGGTVTSFGSTAASNIPYPNPVDGSLLMGKLFVTDGLGLRGEMPGLMAIYHNPPFTGMDTFSGAGETAGKYFRVANCISAAGQAQVAMQRLAPWTY